MAVSEERIKEIFAYFSINGKEQTKKAYNITNDETFNRYIRYAKKLPQ